MVSLTLFMAWHYQKSHVAPHFSHLDLTNAMVPLTMPSALHVACVNANGITLPNSHAIPYFNHFEIRNGMVPLMMPSALCNTDTSGIT